MIVTEQLVDNVNYLTNHQMKYTSQVKGDRFVHGSELEKTRSGDCDDYCVLKAHRLKKLGVHPADMCMGAVASKGGVLLDHAVLLVKGERSTGILWWKKTKPCEWVLDSLTDNLYPIEHTGYIIGHRFDISGYI
jgi:predicted transglutaminase-like cysteine proteinase